MQSPSPSAHRVKAQQIRHWDSVADGWALWLDWTERYFGPINAWFLDAAGWAPGVRALDVACGAGYPAMLGASRVHPGGTQIGIDISPAMVAVAATRARAAGLDNARFFEMDAEDLQFDDSSVHTVTNAYGLMFCPDPQRALNEAHRVLEPGGRLALATWDEPSKSPYFDVITSVAAPILSLAVPEPDAPGPFRLASAARLEAILRAAGFSHVRVERRSATFECASVAEYCQMFSDLAWKSRVAALSSEEHARFQDAVGDAARPFIIDDRLRLPAVSLCGSARKI